MSTTNPSIHERFPLEVMSHIFCDVESLPDQALRVPVMLGLVCTAWRNISLATAALWSFFRLRYGQVTPKTVADALTWLGRSKALPCTVIITISTVPTESPNLVLDIILPVAFRLRTLHIRVPHTMLIGFIEQQPIHMPLLENLELRPRYIERDSDPPLVSPPPNVFAQWTSLCRLDLEYTYGFGLLRDPVATFLWSSLTALTLFDPVSIPADQALQIFCLAINLVKCHFTIPGWYSPPTMMPERCQHLHLSSLKLTFYGGAVTPFFTPIERLPALTFLDIQGNGCGDLLAQSIWELQRNQPFKNLRNFHLASMAVDRNQVMDVIRATPTIEYLYFNGCYILDDDFVSAFIVSPNHPILLSSLVYLYIEEGLPTDLKDETILEFVRSRWIGGVKGMIKRNGTWMKRLRFVLINDGRTVADGILEELGGIKAEGLLLTVPGLEDKSSDEEDEVDDESGDEEDDGGEGDDQEDGEGIEEYGGCIKAKEDGD